MALGKLSSDTPCSLLDPVAQHTPYGRHDIHKMPPFDDWNVVDDEEEEELQDTSVSLHHGSYTLYPVTPIL